MSGKPVERQAYQTIGAKETAGKKACSKFCLCGILFCGFGCSKGVFLLILGQICRFCAKSQRKRRG